MAGSAAEKIGDTPELHEVPALHDALYEIVASGGLGMPRQALAQVERFLHEHARQPKERDEFMALFEAQGLPLPDGSGSFTEPTLTEIAMGPLPLPRATDEPRPLSLDVVRELAEDTEPRIELLEAEAHAPRRGLGAIAPWVAFVVALALCGAGASWAYETLTGLRGELRAAERRGDERERVIRELEGRAQALEDRAVGIQSSVAASNELIQRMDRKSDLLLERLPEPKPRRWARARPQADETVDPTSP